MTRIPGTCGRYLMRDGILYVFCRGTTSGDPWWRNLLVGRVRFGEWRVNRADYHEAMAIFSELPKGYFFAHIVGFSRGAGPAGILHSMIGESVLTLFAPKRLGCRGLVKFFKQSTVAEAYRSDVIPLLPPWYAGWKCNWSGWMWPWDAHKKSARDAAAWRHQPFRSGSNCGILNS